MRLPAASPFRRRWPLLGLAALLLALVVLLLGPALTQAQAQNSAPTVTGVAVTSDAGDDDTYILGETIRITLTFSEAVNVTGSPRLKIDMDPADWGEKQAAYEGGSSTARLTFTHTVVEPNYSTQGIAVLEDTLALNGGSIQSAASDNAAELSHDGLDHDANHKVDWQRSPATTPTVSSVAVTSDAGDDDTYPLGDTITITVTFSEAVNVTGSPRLKIDMDPAEWGEKQVAYHSGSGTARLTFAHTVVEPNISSQGIAVLANSLELNGGSIKSAAFDTDAELAHGGLAHDPSHQVDWQRTQPNRAPVVDAQAENYDAFTGDNNAPSEVLVSKPFYQVFTDPDGDELTFAVSIPEEHRQLVEEIAVTLDKDFQPETREWPPIGTYDRVFFQAADDAGWKGKSPALADPVVVTATLTATDPEGLSVSLDGDFLIHWESQPEVVSATAIEQAIELTFDVAVADDPGPAAEQFTVNVASEDGTTGTVAVSSVSVNGKVVTLGLGTELASGQSVTVAYAHDADTPLKRAADGGDHGASFTGQAVDMSLLNPLGLPQNFAVITEPGVLDLLATWDAVEGATSYRLRWRQVGGEFETANAASVSGAAMGIVTVSAYGQWEVRAQGCNDDGCGPEAAATVDVVPEASLSLERAVDDQGQVRPRTLTVNWDPVEGASSYTLSWERLGGDSQANAQVQAQSAAGARQIRSVSDASLGSGQEADVQTGNRLTFGSDETGAEFAVADAGAYRAEFRALNDDNELVALAHGHVNQAPGQPDTTPPRLVRGEIDGDTMVFYFSEPMDESATGSRFRVTDDGNGNNFTARPSRVEVIGNKVWVHGVSGLAWCRCFYAYYYKNDRGVPAGQRLRDLAGNEVWTPHRSLTGTFPATRIVGLRQVTRPPALQRTTAHHDRLTLTFSKTLDGSSVPSADAFTVMVNGSAASLGAVEPVSVSGHTVTLALASPVASTDAVTVSYAKPSERRLRGAGGTVNSFSSATNLAGLTPTVSRVELTSDAGTDQTYTIGETIRVTLTFSYALDVDTTGGKPRLKIIMDTNQGERWAEYAGGSGTAKLVFAYTVTEPDRSTRGIAVLGNTLELNRGMMHSTATRTDARLGHAGLDHDPSHTVDWQRREPGAPWVTGAAITSAPGSDDTYAQGDVIQVTATFSEAVNVDTTSGTPRLKIRMAPNRLWSPPSWVGRDDAERWADYSGGSGTPELTFAYTVLEVNRSTRGVAVLGSGLQLNGGTIRSTDATPVNAYLWYGELGHDPDHLVDGKAPALLDVAVAGTKVSVTFDEELDGDAVPPASAFTVKRTPQGGGEETVSLSGAPTIAGGAVILTLSDAVAATDTGVKLSYAKPASANKLKDKAGNEAAGFTDRVVDATDTTPPRLVWGQIDGDVLTLYFSGALDEDSVSKGIWEGDNFRLKGDRFRISLTYSIYGTRDGQCPDGNIDFFPRPPKEVHVRGNTVVVAGFADNEKRRASVDWTIFLFRYVADTAFTQRLRDLSGNYVSTPNPYHSYKTLVATEHIFVENVTRLPYPRSASVNGNRLTLTFSAPMDRNWVPEAGAFSVKVNGSQVSLAGSNHGSVSGREVTLTLAAAVASGDTVTVSYTKPESRPMRNVVCEYAPSFTDQAATNATP